MDIVNPLPKSEPACRSPSEPSVAHRCSHSPSASYAAISSGRSFRSARGLPAGFQGSQHLVNCVKTARDSTLADIFQSFGKLSVYDSALLWCVFVGIRRLVSDDGNDTTDGFHLQCVAGHNTSTALERFRNHDRGFLLYDGS